eukprot:158977-Chlamydomonas_euryale.AAC.2
MPEPPPVPPAPPGPLNPEPMLRSRPVPSTKRCTMSGCTSDATPPVAPMPRTAVSAPAPPPTPRYTPTSVLAPMPPALAGAKIDGKMSGGPSGLPSALSTVPSVASELPPPPPARSTDVDCGIDSRRPAAPVRPAASASMLMRASMSPSGSRSGICRWPTCPVGPNSKAPPPPPPPSMRLLGPRPLAAAPPWPPGASRRCCCGVMLDDASASREPWLPAASRGPPLPERPWARPMGLQAIKGGGTGRRG